MLIICFWNMKSIEMLSCCLYRQANNERWSSRNKFLQLTTSLSFNAFFTWSCSNNNKFSRHPSNVGRVREEEWGMCESLQNVYVIKQQYLLSYCISHSLAALSQLPQDMFIITLVSRLYGDCVMKAGDLRTTHKEWHSSISFHALRSFLFGLPWRQTSSVWSQSNFKFQTYRVCVPIVEMGKAEAT